MSKVDTIVHGDHVVPGDAIMRMRRMFWRRSSQPVDQMISQVTASLPLFFSLSEVTTRRQNHVHLFLLTESVYGNLNGEFQHKMRKDIHGCPHLSSGCYHMLGDVPKFFSLLSSSRLLGVVAMVLFL